MTKQIGIIGHGGDNMNYMTRMAISASQDAIKRVQQMPPKLTKEQKIQKIKERFNLSHGKGKRKKKRKKNKK